MRKILLFIKSKAPQIVLTVGALLLFANIVAYGFLFSLNDRLNRTRENLDSLTMISTSSFNDISSNLKSQEEEARVKLNALNSKLDILDSAIKPDEKRRMLIKTVREAIQDNTDKNVDIRTLNRIAISIVDHSYIYNLSIAKVLAQMKQESNFNPRAESRAGAKGLMQIIDTTAEEIAQELGKKRYNIWDINTNIEFGCYYMAKMLDHYDHDYIYALRAYNFGPHNVDKVKVGEADYSIVIEVEDNGNTTQYLVDRKGRFLTNDNGEKITVEGEVPEDYRYPLETQGYIKYIQANKVTFSEYGLDKVE